MTGSVPPSSVAATAQPQLIAQSSSRSLGTTGSLPRPGTPPRNNPFEDFAESASAEGPATPVATSPGAAAFAPPLTPGSGVARSGNAITTASPGPSQGVTIPVSGGPSVPLLEPRGGTESRHCVPYQPEVVSDKEAVMLGIQQLERQQAEQERQAAVTSHLDDVLQQPPSAPQDGPQLDAVRQDDPAVSHSLSGENPAAEDDNTEPSSTTTGTASSGVKNVGMRGTALGRMLRTPLTQKLRGRPVNVGSLEVGDLVKMSEVVGDGVIMSPPLNEGLVEQDGQWKPNEIMPIVYGYLHKLGRNGVWQRRFFETDGTSLTYYKTQKRTKLLASLDLCKVGEISIDEADTTGCTFTIQVAERPYYLRSENQEACRDWVINLNRVREARIQLGGYKLVDPKFSRRNSGLKEGEEADKDRKSRSESGECAARVVMLANRPRTRNVKGSEADDSMRQIIYDATGDELQLAGVKPADGTNPQEHIGTTFSQSSGLSRPDGLLPTSMSSPALSSQEFQSRLIVALHPVTLAGWEKPRSGLHGFSARLARWARRMRMIRCVAQEEDVVGSVPPSPHRPASSGTAMASGVTGAEAFQLVRAISNRLFGGGDGAPVRRATPDGSVRDVKETGAAIHTTVSDGSELYDRHSAWIANEKQLHSRSCMLSDPDDHGSVGTTPPGSATGEQNASRGRVMSDIDEHNVTEPILTNDSVRSAHSSSPASPGLTGVSSRNMHNEQNEHLRTDDDDDDDDDYDNAPQWNVSSGQLS